MSIRKLFVVLMITLLAITGLSACDATSTEDSRDSDVESVPAPGNTDPNEGGGGIDTEGGIESTPEPGGGVPGGGGGTVEPAISWTATAAAGTGGEVMTDTGTVTP